MSTTDQLVVTANSAHERRGSIGLLDPRTEEWADANMIQRNAAEDDRQRIGDMLSEGCPNSQ